MPRNSELKNILARRAGYVRQFHIPSVMLALQFVRPAFKRRKNCRFLLTVKMEMHCYVYITLISCIRNKK